MEFARCNRDSALVVVIAKNLSWQRASGVARRDECRLDPHVIVVADVGLGGYGGFFMSRANMATHKLTGRLVEDWLELENAGIPLEPRKFRVGAKPNAGLMIRQLPTAYSEAKIRELDDGRVAYVMPVLIRRDEPGKTIVRGCTLDVPWDECVEWLEEDQERNRGWYAFSRDYPPKHEFERETVLNHRMHCTLSRGDIREGFLLAVGKLYPPETYRDGEIIPIRFSILDQWDCHPSVTFQLPLVRNLWVRRELDHANRRPRAKRKPLFSCPDRIAPVEKRQVTDSVKSTKEEKRLHADVKK